MDNDIKTTETAGKSQNTFKVIETTEDRYNDMLGAVPPIGFGGSYFLCGEPADQRKCTVTGKYDFTYDGFFASNDWENYYTVDQAVTRAEFKQLIKEVAEFQASNKPMDNVQLCFVD
jgi:hypothetical protein